jgi:hypothetical protein
MENNPNPFVSIFDRLETPFPGHAASKVIIDCDAGGDDG